MDELTLSTEFDDVDPGDIYDCWLAGDKHTEMTGGQATGVAEVGAEFTAWDGYIQGKNLELVPGKRLLQSWRTAEFPDDADDSVLEVLFATNEDGGTVVTIHQKNLPEGDGLKYLQGWEEHYFDPMRAYFGGDSFDYAEQR